jgi:hypothetical protein
MMQSFNPSGSAALLVRAGGLLALGLEPEGVRACLLDEVSGQHRLLGWVGVQTDPTLETPQQLEDACRRLGNRLGRMIWDQTKQQPFLESEDPVRWPPLDQVTLTMMPRSRLRVWLAGLSRHFSLAAVHEAVAASPVRIVGQSCLDAQLDSSRLVAEWLENQVEAVVIAGGYDDPASAAQQALLLLCKMVGQAVARIAPGQRPALFFAGNRLVAEQAETLLKVGEGPVQWAPLGNVQPAPGRVQQAELASALGYFYWRLSERTPGYAKLSRWLTAPGQVSNLAANFAQLTQAWMVLQRLPELHGVCCTADWWLHVWARQTQQGLALLYAEPHTRPAELSGWPAVQLVSGEWPQPWMAASPVWWDRERLAPVIGAVGQVAPLAMLQVLQQDVFERS